MKDEEILKLFYQVSASLGSLNEKFGRLVELEELKIPIGSKLIGVTASTTTSEIKLNPPWMKFIIYNDDGTNGVYYTINEESDLLDTVPLALGTNQTVDLVYPVIHTIYLKAVASTVAVRLFGIEGKKVEEI